MLPVLSRRLVCFLSLCACALFVCSLLPAADAPPGKTLALLGGKIRTQTDAGTVDGTILIRDGKIVAVGSGIAIPGDAQRLDVSGCVVTPGLIDARSSLWVLPTSGARDGHGRQSEHFG